MTPGDRPEGDTIALLYRHYTKALGELEARQRQSPCEFKRGQIEALKIILRDLNKVRPQSRSVL